MTCARFSLLAQGLQGQGMSGCSFLGREREGAWCTRVLAREGQGRVCRAAHPLSCRSIFQSELGCSFFGGETERAWCTHVLAQAGTRDSVSCRRCLVSQMHPPCQAVLR